MLMFMQIRETANLPTQEYFVKLLGRYHGFIKEDEDENGTPFAEPNSNSVRPAETEPNMIR